MVVHDGDVMRFTVDPPEDDTPLIIDANCIEVFELSAQPFKTVRGGHRQVFEPPGGIHQLELPFGAIGEPLEIANELVAEQPFRLSITERADHPAAIIPYP